MVSATQLRLALCGACFLVCLLSSPERLLASGFDFPLGPPDHAGYGVRGLGGLDFLELYNYPAPCGFTYHPGEDWNADGSGLDFGGDGNDVGDPVFASGDGKIEYAAFRSNAWGFIVLIRHEGMFTLPSGANLSTVWSQYAHLASLAMNPRTGQPWSVGDKIMRGDQVGAVGDYPHGSGQAFHLHFEIRAANLPAWNFPCQRPIAVVSSQYVHPTDFINLNRPMEEAPVTFDFVGQRQTWVVPDNVTSITVDARGAQGGGNPTDPSVMGGKGGRVQTTLAVTPGETLAIFVAGRGGDLTGPNTGGPGGFNGGGPGGVDNVDFNGPAGGGGGASDVRQGGDDLAHRVVVAGGGGGAECCGDGEQGHPILGGDGGGTTGASGGTAGGGSAPGGGGTQSSGGAGGFGCNGNGRNGSLGQGGVGGNGNRAGGGGGGGYYGGGGGGGCLFGSGGGGGSSFPAGTGTIHTQGYQTGAGQVVITLVHAGVLTNADALTSGASVETNNARLSETLVNPAATGDRPAASGVRFLAPSPNPVTGALNYGVSVPREARVHVAVYDVRGQLVRTLVDRTLPAGQHYLTWDARGGAGAPLASGVYYLTLEANGERQSRKFVIVR